MLSGPIAMSGVNMLPACDAIVPPLKLAPPLAEPAQKIPVPSASRQTAKTLPVPSAATRAGLGKLLVPRRTRAFQDELPAARVRA